MKKIALLILPALSPFSLFAQSETTSESIWSNPGVLITVTLLLIPILVAVDLVAVKLNNLSRKLRERKTMTDAILKRLSFWLTMH
jgi:cytochrome c oxidase cbb3-type subunit 1